MAHFLKTVRNSVKHWYLILLVGVLFIALGIWVFKTPMEAYVTLSVIFSVTFLVTGIAEIIFAISNRKDLEGWGWHLALGILNAVVGVVLLKYPEVSMTTLPLFVGFVLMFRSMAAIGYSFELKNYGVLDWGNLLAIGVLGFILSTILLMYPAFTGISVVVWTAMALIVIGCYTVYYSFKLKKINKIAKEIKTEAKTRLEEVKNEILDDITKETQAQ